MARIYGLKSCKVVVGIRSTERRRISITERHLDDMPMHQHSLKPKVLRSVLSELPSKTSENISA